MPNSALTLIELNQKVKFAIEQKFDAPVWVVAEINSINRHRSGHCYLEFIQKAQTNDQIIAKTRATIWATQFRMIESYFLSVTKSRLEAGLKVLVKVSVDYHELFGLSLNVRDIDPAYTLGDLERRKKEIINRLVAEGVFDMNKELEMPLAVQNIAVISSSGAAGYEDFINQLDKNKYKYKFSITLFEADMQGNRTEETVTKAINQVFESDTEFDILAILRGGGAKSDLSVFDNYNIAYLITQFPIPVITGIGHERDESVCDMVAHIKLKTPTAVAEFLIDHNQMFEANITEIGDDIFVLAKDLIRTNQAYVTNLSIGINKTKNIISTKLDYCNQLFYRVNNLAKTQVKEENIRLLNYRNRITSTPKIKIKQDDNDLFNYNSKLINASKSLISRALHVIDMHEQNIRLVDPVNVLSRGFSITKYNGKIIGVNSNPKLGDNIETITSKDRILSKIIEIDKVIAKGAKKQK
ncbi:MAG: exodeoxyribonuclease VII large subunit [Bacteroidales bacterium]|nr:exodeoxyribonuclease VII large subunit [Bacteroidales bacterium]MDY0140693.1 exodeoxyribonuclease VII large subunit [Bacteroidales bacterium]